MGNKETERTPLEHRVYVSEFLMDKAGVTWGQFKKFAEATLRELSSGEIIKFFSHPCPRSVVKFMAT